MVLGVRGGGAARLRPGGVRGEASGRWCSELGVARSSEPGSEEETRGEDSGRTSIRRGARGHRGHCTPNINDMIDGDER